MCPAGRRCGGRGATQAVDGRLASVAGHDDEAYAGQDGCPSAADGGVDGGGSLASAMAGDEQSQNQ